MVGDEFATLLGRLKERSGLSYGTLAKRLHLSGSTLHRYVTGEALPTDYAPVERFARLCKATPDELVELHRLWVHADVTRQRKNTAPEPTPAPAEVPAPAPTPASAEAPATEPETAASTPSTPAPDGELVVTGPGPEAEPRPRRGWRRRTVAIAGAAVVAAVVSVALVLNIPTGADGDDKRRTTGASSVSEGPETAPATTVPTPSASGRSGSAGPTPSTSKSTGAGTGKGPGTGTGEAEATAPTVATNPYKWDGPCSQHYLLNREPAQVPPPPVEAEAPGWVSALGGVAGGDHMLALTVQGTGKQTVVVEALHVRVEKKGAPLAWNDYSMGVGCGGDVATKSFAVDLDSPRPDISPVAGQRDFPYKVSESDPEVFYVTARAQAHDVSWYLELDWSSGKQRGTVRIDDNGKPFRTSGNVGRPGYDRPLGWNEWIDRPVEDNSEQTP
ncbi:helix-turn-helix domain-containing protein [Streptomyces sp. NPDC048370]|uniref:helix-turn-helix domain-containing protein n=1 Tax=Streptomyces sp. NPDC048370 TaxID=3365540 RepID=UPI003716ACD8